MAIGSCRKCKKLVKFRNALTMIQPISNDTQCKCFNFSNCFITRLSVCQDTWKNINLSNPTTVLFPFDLYFHIIHLCL